jgi:glutaredoxin
MMLMEQMKSGRVTLYSRPGCHLCEHAADLLEALAAEAPFDLVEVNIMSDPALYERYKWSIPVIVVAGGPIFAAPLDPQAIRSALRDAATASASL